MKFNQIFFLLIFIFFCCPLVVQSKPMSQVKPYSTDLMSEISRDTDLGVVSLRKYSSSLSEDRILDFYRDFSSKKGLEEIYAEDKALQSESDDRFEFAGRHSRIVIIFVPSLNDKVEYYVSMYDRSNAYEINKNKSSNRQKGKKALNNGKRIVFFKDITDPRKVDFMPLYHDVMQLEHVDWKSVGKSMISIGYLTPKKAEDVIKFYIANMPSFGWTLVKRETHYSKYYKSSEWLPMVAPFTYCAYNPCEQFLPQKIPPLSVRGETLTFKNREEKCVVTVHTFDDIVRKSKRTVYDLSMVEKYGSTAIGIAYFYSETDKN